MINLIGGVQAPCAPESTPGTGLCGELNGLDCVYAFDFRSVSGVRVTVGHVGTWLAV